MIPILQRLRNTNLSPGVITLFFFLCPPSMLYFIIRDCYKCKRYAQLLLSIFMGISAMLLFFPAGDLYRHALTFQEINGMSFDEVIIMATIKGKIDFLLFILEYYINKIGLSFGFVRAIFVSVSFYLFMNLYRFFYENKSHDKYYFWVIFFIFPFSAICSGLRAGFATCLFCYVVCKIYLFNKKSCSDILLLLISIFTHTQILIFIILWVISIILPNKMNWYWLLLFAVISFILSFSFFRIIDHLPIGESPKYFFKEYTEGEFSSSDYALSELNFFGLTKVLISTYIVLIYILYTVIRKIKYNKQTKLLYAIMFAILLTSSMFSIMGRICFCFQILGAFYLLKYCDRSKLFLMLLLCVFLITNLMNWRSIYHTNWYYMLFPIPIAVMGDYSPEWIVRNCDEDGTPFFYSK